jgi:tetratricopeptide (TPR) repeat protein
MAEAHSEDVGSASSGGDIGFVPRGATVEEYDKAAFSMQVGEISEPVRSTYGYHIITVTDRKEAEGEEFEAARAEIEDRIRNEKGQEDLQAWFGEVRQAADVVIVDYQMKAFEQLQAGEYENAIHYYKLAIEQQPEDGYLYASLGDAYYRLENMDEAIAQYKKATEIYDDYALFAGLGDLYKEMENYDEAAQAYLRASELVPNDIWTQLAIYQYMKDMDRPDDALIVEERIAAFQERQNEYLKAMEEVETEADVEEVVNEPVEELDGDSDPDK